MTSDRQHAILGPSGAERWISCPASVRMAEKVPPQRESPYAIEGTIAHARAELDAALAFGHITPAQHTRKVNAWRQEWDVAEETEEEMVNHTAGYVGLLRELTAGFDTFVILLERRVQTGVPSSWGTADAVIIGILDGLVYVIVVDFKYGSGVRVEAPDNPQLKLYAVGALDEYADLLGLPESVQWVVYQPRLDHTDSGYASPDELRAWRDSIIPVAEEALGDNAHFGPSETACRWCPAAGLCRAQLEWATQADFGGDPDLLSPDELADALAQAPAAEQWAQAVRDAAFDLAYNQQKPVPGFKVVRGNGRRYITDQDAALEALLMVGHTVDEVSKRSMKGIGDLEKLLGKTEFATVLEPFLDKKPGNPALVPESDKRSAIDPNSEAAKEFS